MAGKQILIADDDDMLRVGLRAVIEELGDYGVVGEARTGREAVKLCRRLEPDIVVMDVSMPDMNGVDATERVVHQVPGVRVLAFSMHSDARFIRRMLDAGASGYVPKSHALEEMGAALKALARGQTYLSPSVTGQLLDAMGAPPGAGEDAAIPLTVREREVLQMIAEGHSAGEIAERLSLSVKTVESHRRRVMHKLDLHSVALLTKYAIRAGLTSLD